MIVKIIFAQKWLGVSKYIISYKYNGVGVLRGHGHIPSKIKIAPDYTSPGADYFLTSLHPNGISRGEVKKFNLPQASQTKSHYGSSLRASSAIWASEASLARTRERAAKPRGAEERPHGPSLARSREARRRACSQAIMALAQTH